MKKILSILASVGLTATTASAVVACGNNKAISVETVNKTATDLVLAADHQSATLSLTTGEALQLELVQQSENGYVNGINLPQADVTTVINGVNIVATFTPNLENGVVIVTLRASEAITAPQVTFVFGGGKTKLNIANLKLDFVAKTIVQKSATLGTDHRSAILKLTTAETLALGLTEEVAPGSYQYGNNYPNSTNGMIKTVLNDRTTITVQIQISLSDALGVIKLKSDKPMNGETNVSLVLGNQILVIDYNVMKNALMNSDHQSATLKLTSEEALYLGLAKIDSQGNYSNGENWAPTFVTKLDSATITASVPTLDNPAIKPDGSVLITLTTNQLMSKASDVEFKIGTFKLVVNQLNLDFKTIVKTITTDESSQSLTTKLTTAETLALGLTEEVAPGSYQYGNNYPNSTNGMIRTVLDDGTNITAQFEISPSDATGSIKITSDRTIPDNTVINFKFGDYSLIVNINFVSTLQTEINQTVNNDANHETGTLTLTQNEALSLKLTQINPDGTIGQGDNWIDSYQWTVGTNQALVSANFELKPWTYQVEITFRVNKAMVHAEELRLSLGNSPEFKSLLIISGLELDYVRTDPTILQKYPILASNHQSATFDLTFSDALSLKLTRFDNQGGISQGINWPDNNKKTTQLDNQTVITATFAWRSDGSVKVTLTSSQRMEHATDVSFSMSEGDRIPATLLVSGLNLDYDAEVIINKTDSDVKISADGKVAVLTLTALEAESLQITPSTGMTTYFSESTSQVMATPSWLKDGVVELELTPLDAMDEPVMVTFDFGYPDYSAKKLVIKDLYLDLVGEVVHQGSELTIDHSTPKPQAKLTLTAAEARSLGLSRLDYFKHWSTTTPIVKAALDFNDPFVFTFIFTAPEPITTPVTVSFSFAKPGQTPKTLTIQDFILN